MKNSNDRIPHGLTVDLPTLSTEAGKTSNGALAAARAGLMLLEPAPVRKGTGDAAKRRHEGLIEEHAAAQQAAARLIAALVNYESSDVAGGALSTLARTRNDQLLTEQRDAHVKQEVEKAKAEFYALAFNTFSAQGNRAAFKGLTSTTEVGLLNTGHFPQDEWLSAARQQARMLNRVWKGVADDAMTDHLAVPQQFVVPGKPDTYGELLNLRRNARLARTFTTQAGKAPAAFAPVLTAAATLANGEGTVDDVSTISVNSSSRVTATAVLGMLHPALSLADAMQATLEGKVTHSDLGALRTELEAVFLPDIAGMAVTFGIANRERFAGRVESAMTAFVTAGLTCLKQWRPWIAGAHRSLAEVLISTAEPTALKETASEWMSLAKALEPHQMRVYAIVTEARKTILSHVNRATPEDVLAFLKIRGDLLNSGEQFTLELVEANLRIEDLSQVNSLDVQVGRSDDGRDKPLLGELIPTPYDLDAVEDRIMRDEEMAYFRVSGAAVNDLEEGDEIPYIDTIGDDEAMEYLRQKHNTSNVQLLRGLLKAARKIREERDELRLSILTENGMVRADGTSIFVPYRLTDTQRQLWNEARRSTERPRVRARRSVSDLVETYTTDSVVPTKHVVLTKVIETLGDDTDLKRFEYVTARRFLITFFRECLRKKVPTAQGVDLFTQRPRLTSRLLNTTDLIDATHALNTHMGHDKISVNMVHDVAWQVEDEAFGIRKFALKQEAISIAQATRAAARQSKVAANEDGLPDSFIREDHEDTLTFPDEPGLHGFDSEDMFPDDSHLGESDVNPDVPEDFDFDGFGDVA